MRILVSSVAAATAVLGYNLLRDEVNRTVGYDRIIVAYGLTGSAVVGDTVVQVKVGGAVKATIINTVLGVAVTRDHMLADRIFVPRNVEVEAVVTDAAATNPVSFVLLTLP